MSGDSPNASGICAVSVLPGGFLPGDSVSGSGFGMIQKAKNRTGILNTLRGLNIVVK